MSTTIEQRVVEMQFDNKQFEQGVSTTMSSLGKLEQSLNLTGASKGLESVGAAARGINLSGLTSAAETVGLKFNAMWTIADQALRNITNSAYYAGKRIASALTIDPIKTGFAEYETQINSVQTILANTESKGTTIGDVNKALDELNTYADQTIYNFTEMTKNIGRFTAAGVDLDKSVSAIKGIANLAAVSGSNSQQASTAMYQLSQALASGKVNLMDWNSVVDAGMGGEVFQNALKRTAEVMNGVDVDAIIKKYGSFRESLSRGDWLTTDVLSETLSQIAGAYTEADLLAQGYSEEQTKAILKLADTAESAATDVKTLTQLWDTLKESAQSGWAQTWEIVVGDFEEAKALFSKISEVVGGVIGDAAKARNELLQGWKDEGGRKGLIDSFTNAFEGLMNIITPIKEAFREIFPPMTVEQLVNFTKHLKLLTGRFENFTKEHAPQIKSAFKGIFAAIDIGWTFIKDLVGGIGDLVGNFKGLGGGILDAAGSIGDWLVKMRDAVKEGDYFGAAIDKIVGFVGLAIDKVKGFGAAIKNAFQSNGIQRFMDILSGIWDVIMNIGSKIGEMFAPLGEAFRNLFANGRLAESINSSLSAVFLAVVAKMVWEIGEILEPIRQLFLDLGGWGIFTGQITQFFDSIIGCFEAFENKMKAQIIKEIAIAIAILAGALFVLSSIKGDALDQSLGAITVLFTELIGSLAIFTKLDFGGKGLIKGVSAINGLAAALLVLSVAMKIMSTMSWSEIGVGIVGTVAGLGALVAAVNLLPEKNVLKASKAIGKMATALVILAAGMKIMASMSWQELGVAVTGVVAGLGALVAGVNLLPKDAGVRSLGMVGLATSMVILGGALKIMSTMSWDELGRGLAAMAGSLAAIVIAINLMPKDAAIRSVGMVGLATAMVILGAALKSMGGMSWEEIGRGLVVMGGALAELAIALNFMTGAIAGAGALIIAAGALAILAPVMQSLGDMTWGEIAKGLVAMAGAFAIIGVAGALLTPLIPTLLSLAGAMAAFGGATLALGVGVAAIAWGFTVLASAGAAGATAFVAALGALTVGIIGLIPAIVRVVTDLILALCDVVIEVAPKLADTILIVISEVLSSLATYTPQIVDSLLQFLIGVLDALAANMPQLIESAVAVIGAFFQGIVDALSGIDTSSIFKGIVGVGLLTGLMYALSALLPMIPGALAGVIGMGVLIAELAAVLAAVGLLAQIPGLSWLIGEGGDLLQQIGTAIGQFIGGIVGGIAEGATSTLPQVGTNLSEFMTNLQPFITGMQGIDSSIIDNTTSLAGAILALTAADLLSGITSFLTGGQSLGDFAKQIVPFGTAMKEYAAEVAGIDTASITTSVGAAKDLVKIAGEIPSDGMFGTDGIDDFGKNLVKFGKCMNEYAAEVAGIDAASITASVSAAKGLVSVANQLPDDGAFGTDGIDNFGDNIVDFAKSMKKYADNVADISIGAVTKSVSVVRSLISVINGMAGMDSSGVKTFKNALKDLSKVNVNGFINAFTTSTAKLTNVGKNMFGAIIKGAESMKSEFSTSTVDMLNSAIEAINGKMTQFNLAGLRTINEFMKGILLGKPRIISTFGVALVEALGAIRSYEGRFYSAGGYLVSGMARGIRDNKYQVVSASRAMAAAAVKAAEDELDINSPSKVGYGIGDFFGLGFVNAIADYSRKAYSESSKMGSAAESGLSSAFDKVRQIISGEVDINPTISPVLDLTNVRAGANAISSMLGFQPSVGVLAQVGAVSSMMNSRGQNGGADEIVSAINKLQGSLGNVGGTTNIINGITYGDDSAINSAIQAIVRAILVEGRV